MANERKLIKIEFTLTFEDGTTPNILTPKLCEIFEQLGVVNATGSIKNVVECDNEVNAVSVVCG